jgi:transcriptional repressor NrdR
VKCPYCQHPDSKVIDSRDAENAVRRRRQCEGCGRRFTTYERIQLGALLVKKSDGRREEFSREKLAASVRVAFQKRPVAPADLEALVDAVEAEVHQRSAPEVPSAEIGELVMARMRALDEIAYIRFASAYRAFGDLESLRGELDNLIDRQARQRQERDQPTLLPSEDMVRLLQPRGSG